MGKRRGGGWLAYCRMHSESFANHAIEMRAVGQIISIKESLFGRNLVNDVAKFCLCARVLAQLEEEPGQCCGSSIATRVLALSVHTMGTERPIPASNNHKPGIRIQVQRDIFIVRIKQPPEDVLLLGFNLRLSQH